MKAFSWMHRIQKLRYIALVLLLLGSWRSVEGQRPDAAEKYWIMLTDKGDYEKLDPRTFLTERALARRTGQGIGLDQSDFPLRKDYLDGLEQQGVNILQQSKWFNAVSAWLTVDQLQRVADLPFVKGLRPIPRVTVDYDAPEVATKFGYNTGHTAQQLEMVGLEQMHQNGYAGWGVLIAVMDNGFRGVNENPVFQHLFEHGRVLGTRDFVNGEEGVYGSNDGTHGAFVLSILAAWSEDLSDSENNYYGSAYAADYLLCHTENDFAEEHQEEDNWVAAMEYADSMGADILSTSLGYRDFDNGDDYGYEGMDGNTAIITIGADLAASKGMLVVTSAGNAGNGKILAPADGDSVIAIGAVDEARVIAGFSSRGPSYDGRVKPDVSAMGRQTAFVNTVGSFSRGNGTSFSCPVVAGMLACLLQAAPETSERVMYDALIRSADRFNDPDSVYGYGIPYAPTIYTTLTGATLSAFLEESDLADDGVAIFPNPAGDYFNLVIDNDLTGFEGTLQIADYQGKLVYEKTLSVRPFYNLLRVTRSADYPHLPTGKYVVRLLDGGGSIVRFTGTVFIGK